MKGAGSEDPAREPLKNPQMSRERHFTRLLGIRKAELSSNNTSQIRTLFHYLSSLHALHVPQKGAASSKEEDR